ncbi:MAG: S8/S53 family peptidase [Gemmatimonadetes bacterium]|nr:S8/S53 family peptidase [Gemmatimonadota bacterium]
MTQTPYDLVSFEQIRVLDTWRRYADRLTWGRGQCLAILDDGCDLSDPPWQVELPWGPKVIASYNSIEGNADPTPVPPGYHGTSVGYPSSFNHEGTLGIAYDNHVAHVRAVSIVHLTGQTEADTMATGLRWVLEHYRQYNITAVNLSPVDDERHHQPVATVIDEPLRALRQLGIWVSAPCGNHGYTDGISWPACQPHCIGVGATIPGQHKAHLDRFTNTDLLVAAAATSSSNACAAACSMILREAIDQASYAWQGDGPTLTEALLAIFQLTGVSIEDPQTETTFRELDLLAAVDYVLGEGGRVNSVLNRSLRVA